MMFTANISNCSNTIVPGPNVTEAEYIQQLGSYCCLGSRSVCDVAVPSSMPSSVPTSIPMPLPTQTPISTPTSEPTSVPTQIPSSMLDNSLLCEQPVLYMGNATTPYTGCASGDLDLCTSEDEWRCDGLMIQLYDMLPGPINECSGNTTDMNKMNGKGNMTHAEVIQTYGYFCCKNAFSACGEADSSLVPLESPSANADKFQNKEAAKYMCDQRKALLHSGQRTTLMTSPHAFIHLLLKHVYSSIAYTFYFSFYYQQATLTLRKF